MRLKRIVVLILICTVLTGCGKKNPTEKKTEEKVEEKVEEKIEEKTGQNTEVYKVTVQGAIFGGASDDRIETEVSYNPEWITENDNTKYNKDLAQFAAILSDDVYFRTKDLDKDTQNRVLYEGENEEEYEWTSFLKHIGFSEIKYVESFREREYASDSNDSATLLLAHKVVDEKYDLFVIVLRGCFSAQEWISVFDPGSDSEAYANLTGEHPEWTDKNAFKGLDIAKNRALTFIDEFIAQNDNADYQNCVLVTGHSRGGALANMIGAEMERRTNIRSYTYTFNAPGVTTDTQAPKYKTIFNVFDSNDYYTDPLPFGNETFYRYGCDITASISDSQEACAEITRLKGRDDYASLDADTKAEFRKMFGQRFPNRASLYEMNEAIRHFPTAEEAASYEEQCNTLISSESGLGLVGLCTIETFENNGQYEVTLHYCGGAILLSYAKTLAYGQAAYDATVMLFEEDTAACEILTLLMNHATGLNGGHLLVNSYILAGLGQP